MKNRISNIEYRNDREIAKSKKKSIRIDTCMNKFKKKYGNKQINKTMCTSINREQMKKKLNYENHDRLTTKN